MQLNSRLYIRIYKIEIKRDRKYGGDRLGDREVGASVIHGRKNHFAFIHK